MKETSKDSDTPTNPANKRQKSTDDTEDANEDEEAGGADFNPEEEVTTGVYGRIYQLPENVPVITGEEGEECTFTSRAKLYRLVRKAPKGDDSKNGSNATSPREDVISPTVTTSSTDADWSEVGIGPIKILKSVISTTKKGEKQIDLPAKETQENNVESVNESDDKENSKDVTELLKFRLVMRRESSRGGPGTKVLLNAAIKGYVTVAKISDKMFRMSCICPRDENSPELVPATFLFKTKTTAEADDLYEEIKSIVDHFNTVAL